MKSDGTVWAWGGNASGALGTGGLGSPNYPAQVLGLTEAVAIAGGGSFSLAARADGTAWAWGNNVDGQLGTGTSGSTTNAPTPVQVKGPGIADSLTDVVAVAAGQRHALALKWNGTVWAWGHNGDGQLGTGNTTASNRPVQVSGLEDVVAIAAGYHHSLALKADGSVWTWGQNSFGQLGDGTTTGRLAPVQLDLTPPAEVTGAAVTVADGKLTVTWTDPGDADLAAAVVYVAAGSDPAAVTSYVFANSVNPGVQAQTVTGRTNGQPYVVRITTKDDKGNESAGIWLDNSGAGYMPIATVSFTFTGLQDLRAGQPGQVGIKARVREGAVPDNTPLRYRLTLGLDAIEEGEPVGGLTIRYTDGTYDTGIPVDPESWPLFTTDAGGRGYFPETAFTPAERQLLVGDPGLTTALRLTLAEADYELRIELLDWSDPASPVRLGQSESVYFRPVDPGGPLLDPLLSPTLAAEVTLRGSAPPDATVTVHASLGGEPQAPGTAQAGSDGRFSLDFSLPAEGTYSFWATATVEGQTGAASPAVLLVVDRTPPGSPLGLSATLRPEGAVGLSWQAPVGENAASYRIRRAAADQAPALVGTAAGNGALTFVDADLAPGTVYTYSVTAADAVGNESLPSDPVTYSTESPVITDLAWQAERDRHGQIRQGGGLHITLTGTPGRTAAAELTYLGWSDANGAPVNEPVQRQAAVPLTEDPGRPGRYTGEFAVAQGVAEVTLLRASLTNAGGSVNAEATGLPRGVAGTLTVQERPCRQQPARIPAGGLE